MRAFGSRRKAITLLAFLAFSAAILPSAEASRPQSGTPVTGGAVPENEDYVIGPQNVIQVKIFGEAATNQIYRVDEGGNINHALVGRVNLAGKTVAEAEKIMEEKLSGDYIVNPHVTIFVLEFSRFSILGEVQRPGTYEITGHVSVLEAISMAGGFTRVANSRGVRIIRKAEGKEQTIDIDTTEITDQGKLSSEVSIQADDVIVVSKSFF
ncbi:MAG TPA: polysaccharide biosynthesis/export family protein [Candidatus Eisenbacteria bacterium]|nr:polysaccharide biosynthesis/export family protein [Candidatus Eisenbacteria bacterium]